MEEIQIIEKAIRENRFVEFIYHDTRRIVAPYRLEELKDGTLVLSGVRESGRSLRAFKLEEIAGIDLLNKTFDSSLFHGLGAPQQSSSKKLLSNINIIDKIRGLLKRK